jgi:hypothetical protein
MIKKTPCSYHCASERLRVACTPSYIVLSTAACTPGMRLIDILIATRHCSHREVHEPEIKRRAIMTDCHQLTLPTTQLPHLQVHASNPERTIFGRQSHCDVDRWTIRPMTSSGPCRRQRRLWSCSGILTRHCSMDLSVVHVQPSINSN